VCNDHTKDHVIVLSYFVSAPECRDIETALYDRTYVFNSLPSRPGVCRLQY